MLNAWSVVCGLESQVAADPQGGGLGCLALWWGASVHPRNVHAGRHQKSVSPTCSFQQGKRAQRGPGFLQGLLAGPVRIRSTNWSSRVDTWHRHVTHSSQMWVRLALETGGGIRLAVMRKKTPGRRTQDVGAWSHGQGTLYGEMAPRAWGRGCRPECPSFGSAPSSHDAWTAQTSLGLGE